jgi:lipocalin-like protein
MKLPMRLTAVFLLFSGIALLAGAAVGQQNTLKEQIVGTWTVVSLINERNGKQIEPFGPNPKGYFMFDSSGHFSTHIIRSYRPKFAHRDNPTPMESKAVVEGTISAFGTYTVNEADHSVFMGIIGSSFPTWDNTYQKRFITITGGEMKYINPTPATGGGTAMVILKRAE